MLDVWEVGRGGGVVLVITFDTFVPGNFCQRGGGIASLSLKIWVRITGVSDKFSLRFSRFREQIEMGNWVLLGGGGGFLFGMIHQNEGISCFAGWRWFCW